MHEETTPNNKIAMLLAHQTKKEVTINEAILAIDALLNNYVDKMDIEDLDAIQTPLPGRLYIIGQTPKVKLKGQENHLAYFYQGWRFIAPNKGLLLWVEEKQNYYRYDGERWVNYDPKK
jgi:hypothetical protein